MFITTLLSTKNHFNVKVILHQCAIRLFPYSFFYINDLIN